MSLVEFLDQISRDLEDILEDIEYDFNRTDSVAQTKIRAIMKQIEDRKDEV
jgi:hypothetical protein